MHNITVAIRGVKPDYNQAKRIAEIMALRDNESATLVSWFDRDRGTHSPQCLRCELKGAPGWEVYGRNHEGRLRISFNDDQFVFIYS
ncbi:MAG: hypothetical protein GXP57_01520 [Deltaproteobacteria bacterium]|nr:hypothetical protein [Deltaproteobacteria bacterium]